MNKNNNDSDAPEIGPEFAVAAAEQCVLIVKKVYDIDLDFTPESLTRVETIFDSLREEGCKANEVTGFLTALGCYLGEVIVRNIGGVWRPTVDTVMATSTDNVVVIELTPPGIVLNPLGKAYKRMVHGSDDNVEAYYYWIKQTFAAEG